MSFLKRLQRGPAILLTLGLMVSALSGCFAIDDTANPRLTLFVGVDVSGSYMKGKYYDDSIEFLSNYIYAHLKGLGGLEVPKSLFVGSIGGSWTNDVKSFYPIETFQDKNVDQIKATLYQLFPKSKINLVTDFNVFFKQIQTFVQNKNLILKPISIVLVSDGIPDAGRQSFGTIKVKGLETLSRNVTIRLLYTDPNTGSGWQNKIKRTRVRIWTQDADVMVHWREPTILDPTKPLEQQQKFFDWIKNNVDFGVRAKRVD